MDGKVEATGRKSLGQSIRRSGVKLRSFRSNQLELNLVLCQLRELSQSSVNLMTLWSGVGKDLVKWSTSTSDNKAISDVFDHMNELIGLYVSIQREQSESINEFRKYFEQILEGEKNLEEARSNFDAVDAKENKYKKEIQKITKKKESKKPNESKTQKELEELETKIQNVEREKDLEQDKVTKLYRENEMIKHILLKKALTKLSDVFFDAANKCSLLFSAQMDVVAVVPDGEGTDVSELVYEGKAKGLTRILSVKDQIQNYRRDVSPLYSNVFTPPTNPYYSPQNCVPLYSPPSGERVQSAPPLSPWNPSLPIQ